MDDPSRAGALEVAEGERLPGSPCACCAGPGELVWGFVNDAGSGPVCVYYVHWTLGRADHGAHFDLIVGPWGAGTGPADRIGVSLVYRRDVGAFTVIDAAERPFAEAQRLFSRALGREEVVTTPIAASVYRLVDAIWLGDSRIGELRARRGG
ncbi:MAG TPA: hypothetical protein VMU00_07760 [Steroidobacteraceae bacterium]|nr:hypothetical protein [Steroidobacteraceae bacterium]